MRKQRSNRMMKIISQVFTTLFLFGTMAAQAQEQDTLLTDYLQKAQYQQAIEYIDLQEPTRDSEYQKALCYKWLSNHSKAIEILESLQEIYPDDIPVQLELAQCYETNLQYPQSISCYEKLIEEAPANTYFQVRKADLLYRAEKYARALEDYLQIDPETYNPVYLKKSIALCYDKLNQPDSAKVHYLAAWEIDAHDIFSALSLVKLCIQQKDYTQALLYSEAFLSADTTNAQMNVLNALAYYNLDAYEDAIPRLEKCHSSGDSSLVVNRSLGISYFFLQNDTAAYPYLKRAYERDTTSMTVLYAFAQVSYNLEHYPEAIRAYQMLIKWELPNRNSLCTYYTGLAQACEKDSLYQEAAGQYMSAIQYASTNIQKMKLLFNLSTLLEFNLKNYKTAISYYSQYQTSLMNYQIALEEEQDPNPEEIKEVELKINELEKHIRKLKAENEVK